MSVNLCKFGTILSDRGSKYAVSCAAAPDRSGVDAALKALKCDKAYAKATHNTWGILLPDGTPLKGDDGETGAGMVILRMLERADVRGQLIIVTRWYGGKHLGGDRFRHVQTCVETCLSHLAEAQPGLRL